MLSRAASQRPDGASGEEPGVEGVRAANCRDAAADGQTEPVRKGRGDRQVSGDRHR
jgi:hypothetical protein